MPDLIAIQEVRIGPNLLIPGDKIDLNQDIRDGYMNAEAAERLRQQRYFGNLDRGTFAICLARRPAGSPWPPRGFTEAYLIEKGVWDKPADPKPAPAPKAAEAVADEKKGGRPPKPPLTKIEIKADAVVVGQYRLQPRKTGNFTWWDAADADGNLLRDKSFRKKDEGVAFLTELKQNGGPKVEPDPATAQETQNGGHLQSGADDPAGSGTAVSG